MPTYEYECKCGAGFQQFNKISERNNAICPDCNSTEVTKLISKPCGIMFDTNLRDLNGTPVWFPKDGRPYFDRALRRTFYDKKEKVQYMNDNKLVMDGSETPQNMDKIPEAGDMRSRSTRKVLKMED